MIHTTNLPNLIKYLHAVSFSQVQSTWISAIRKVYLQSWTGLTEEAVQKHVPKSEVIAMGHIDKTINNKKSTQPNPDTNIYKQYKPSTPDSLHISNTETTHIIFSDIEKRDASTLTKHVVSLLLKSMETSMSASCITMMPTQY